MYAIIETGGKQYRVEPGALLRVETLPGEVGGIVELTQVRLIQNDGGLTIGRPWIERGRVKAEIVQQGRSRSIMVFKKKRRKNYRRTKGHRQGFTQLRITDITST